MKILPKKLISIIFVCFILIYVPLVPLKQYKNLLLFNTKQEKVMIYTIWHIETFEGGKLSRIDYLKMVAKQIEKSNSNIIFNIINIDCNKLNDYLSLSCPDIISFGFGVGKNLLPKLEPITNEYCVRDSLLASGYFNNKLYAIPYIASGYALCYKTTNYKSILVGSSRYTSPQINQTTTKLDSQYTAYKTFISGKDDALLGTARDVFRITNKMAQSNFTATIIPQDNYTDLIQYIAKTKTDSTIDAFIANLLSQKNQQKLSDYRLFSTLNNTIYSSGIYFDMERAIIKSTTPSCF